MVVFISLNGGTPGEFMMLTITDVTNMLHKVHTQSIYFILLFNYSFKMCYEVLWNV